MVRAELAEDNLILFFKVDIVLLYLSFSQNTGVSARLNIS